MEDKRTDRWLDETEKKKLVKNLKVFLVMAIVAIIIFVFPDIKPKEETETADFSDVDKICELATLRCYYHDVAEYEKQPDGLFKYGLFQYGYKKMWMEYDGIVEIGIDIGEVQVNAPDEQGVVRIYVPKAKVLGIDADENSMDDPIEETGQFTTISAQEKAKAFSEAQTNMKANAEADSSMLIQAQNNAKQLLKQYVINVGEQTGQKYTVEWIEKPQSGEK